jgi:hypothetical protein
VKKAYKYTLAAVGIPLLCFGGLALDSYYRAVSAIAAHDARLAKDIAAMRTRHSPQPMNVHPFEDGHSRRNSDDVRRFGVLDRRRPSSPDEALNLLESAQARLREGGYEAFYERKGLEVWMLTHFLDLLRERPLPAGELRDLSRSLDRIHSNRPTVSDIITGEHLLDRAEILNVLHLKRDPSGMIRRPPGWREFFSWRILIAKTLLQLDDHYREILPLASVPRQDREKAVSQWSAWSEDEGVTSRTYLRTDADRMLRHERTAAAEWHFTHLVMALLLFQSERGRDPQELQELVPDYLPCQPVSLFDGAPVVFEKGVLHDVGLDSRWRLAPK